MRKPDRGDWLMIIGIGLIGYGLAVWMPWVSCVTVGVILLALGFIAPGSGKGER